MCLIANATKISSKHRTWIHSAMSSKRWETVMWALCSLKEITNTKKHKETWQKQWAWFLWRIWCTYLDKWISSRYYHNLSWTSSCIWTDQRKTMPILRKEWEDRGTTLEMYAIVSILIETRKIIQVSNKWINKKWKKKKTCILWDKQQSKMTKWMVITTEMIKKMMISSSILILSKMRNLWSRKRHNGNKCNLIHTKQTSETKTRMNRSEILLKMDTICR